MSISAGVLAWRSPKTLEQTLRSLAAVCGVFAERVIFAQERASYDHVPALAERYGWGYISAQENIGIGPAFSQLVRNARSETFLFIEEDFRLSNGIAPDRARDVLTMASVLLEHGDSQAVDVVRLRSVKEPGEPVYAAQTLRGREREQPSHLLESVHWLEHPDVAFPQAIRRTSEWYLSTSANACYTNNPCMYRVAWLKEIVLPWCGGSGIALERDIQPWWETQNFVVGMHVEGLFTHERID